MKFKLSHTDSISLTYNFSIYMSQMSPLRSIITCRPIVLSHSLAARAPLHVVENVACHVVQWKRSHMWSSRHVSKNERAHFATHLFVIGCSNSIYTLQIISD